MKKIIFILLTSLLFLFSTYIVLTYMQIKKAASMSPPNDVPYLIVLGAKVNGDQLSKALLYRAETALNYWENNQSTIIVVTGGQGKGEDMTEASALMHYFMENGVPEDRILIEDQSISTYENLLFTKELFSIKEAVIVSNDFHLYRAIEMARTLKITAYPLAANTPKSVKFVLYLREYAAILKMHVSL